MEETLIDLECSFPHLDTNTGITLDEPDLDLLRRGRMDRNREFLQGLNPVIAAQVLPLVSTLLPEERAAINIQRHIRGHLGRKKYTELLYQQFEKEERMRLEKVMSQVEEGQLLVENHQLEVQFDDDNTTRRNRSRHYITNVITIQRAWRASRCRVDLANANMSPALSEGDELSETESAGEHQGGSLSTPEENTQGNIIPIDDIPYKFGCSSFRRVQDVECESIASDYSEIAAPLKDLADNELQIIHRSDLEQDLRSILPVLKTKEPISRDPNESDEDFSKRVRKINLLSLAQEFADLKKIDANALPFDLHKGHLYDESPMSDTSFPVESDQYLTESAMTTPVEVCKEFIEDNFGNKTADNDTESDENRNNVLKMMDSVKSVYKPIEQTLDNLDRQMTNTRSANYQHMSPKNQQNISNNRTTTANAVSEHEHSNRTTTANAVGEHEHSNRTTTANAVGEHERKTNSPKVTNHRPKPDQGSPRTKELAHGEVDEGKRKSDPPSSEKFDDFDVYNIESTLPQMDWATLERKLQKAADEEKQRSVARKNDREEIRKKLAMGVDEDYYDNERTFKKPNLQTRLQGGMNLQICFMNDAPGELDSDQDPGSLNGDLEPDEKSTPINETIRTEHKVSSTGRPDVRIPPQGNGMFNGDNQNWFTDPEENEDFLKKQQRLQAEAKLALAQATTMAHMQLQVEKQLKKKSPIADMVGIPGFGNGRRKLCPHVLQMMNIGQLQVLINDIHTQIESLNEELVQLLVGRDDLHMEQDSMLVDIEDLTRRAQEYAEKINSKIKSKKK